MGPSDDLHMGLRTNTLRKEQRAGVDLVLGQVVDGKDRAVYAVHARPPIVINPGVQVPHLLGALGFQWTNTCKFTVGGAACHRVAEEFDLGAFADALEKGYALLKQAGSHLKACGYDAVEFDDPGAKFIFARPLERLGRDGHIGAQDRPLKNAEDQAFRYVLTWIDGPGGRGWVTHCAAKQPPLSADIERVFAALDLHPMAECPEFNFDPCHWSLYPKQLGSRRGDPTDWAHTDRAHKHFEAHASHYSDGIAKLLEANGLFVPLGMELLPPPPSSPAPRPVTSPRAPQRSSRRGASPPPVPHYHVAFSFAGTEREIVKRIVAVVEAAGYTVFYDDSWKSMSWGQDLSVFLDKVYRENSDFCVVMASKEYLERDWPRRELQSVRARAVQQKDTEYVLPVRVDVEPAELPGVLPSIAYLDLAQHSPEEIGALLVEKLQAHGIRPPARS
jgi:hypothetical protein